MYISRGLAPMPIHMGDEDAIINKKFFAKM
jgi:hypothetical protein